MLYDGEQLRYVFNLTAAGKKIVIKLYAYFLMGLFTNYDI